MCYTCIRECPAKAIRVADAQANIESSRCIGCGNCVRVCAQGAKMVHSEMSDVKKLLQSGAMVVAVVAPSFPAEFMDVEPNRLAGALGKLGFYAVHEVAFGADLVAHEYARILETTKERYIGSTCPAVVSFVEKYYPELVHNLMPVVSPMVATARVARQKYGPEVKVVFVGPCIAKKGEAFELGEVNAVLTFTELRELFRQERIELQNAPLGAFAGPRGGVGGLFAVTRGLLQAAGLKEDILTCDIIAAEGNPRFISAINEFYRGGDNIRLLELLSCNGCVSGVGFSSDEPLLLRRRRVADYVKQRVKDIRSGVAVDEVVEFCRLDLRRSFSAHDTRLPEASQTEITRIFSSMGKHTHDDELNCGACGYTTCRQCANAIARGLAEPEMCLPYTIEHLKDAIGQLENSNRDLRRVREALSQSEKLASMGQMAAGIAHEVNNPLGIVLLYANLMLEQCEQQTGSREDLEIIVEQANRCKKIVTGLLNFSRQNKVFRQETNMVELAEKTAKEYLRPESVRIVVEHETSKCGAQANIDADQIVQVLVNFLSNSCAAMPNGGDIKIRVATDEMFVTLVVEDNGTGIAEENIAKVFDPFFSTKPVGRGTGLGLAVVHGIVKMHQGKIAVESNANASRGPTGTRFTVTIPRDEP
jgi:signal transduction histidine kinase/Fe-S-cluster-containing hydrogenase component 2